MFDEILTLTALKATDVLACYAYGSRVYGTATAASDYDFIVVADAEEREINDGTMNIHVDHPDNFQRRLREHDISCMECYFLPVRRDFIFKGRPWNFELDRQQLRHAISAKASNSFVKAKKKIMVETDKQWVGMKSLFHSFRIVDFGTQIAKDGWIRDYSSSNTLWHELVKIGLHMEKEGWSWDVLRTEYKPAFNEAMSEFRKYAEK